MITFQQAEDLGICANEALSLMMLKGSKYKAHSSEYGSTSVDYTDTQIVVYHNGAALFHIETLTNIRLRLSVPQHLNYIKFYTPCQLNEKGEIRKRAESLYTDTSEIVELVPQVSEEDWDSTHFQLSTMYEEKIVDALMLEPYINEQLSRHFPVRHYRLKLYTISPTWTFFPYECIAQDIYMMNGSVEPTSIEVNLDKK